MIAGHAQGGSAINHRPYQPQNFRRFWAAVDKIAQKNRLSSRRWHNAAFLCRVVAKLVQQFDQFVIATVNVANNIERPIVELPIIPKRLALDGGLFDFVGGFECVHIPKSFAFKSAKTTAKLRQLVADHMRAERSIRPALITLVTELLGYLQ